MQQFKHWPTALQRRWLLSWAAGGAFLVIGVAVFFALDDQALLVISILLSSFFKEKTAALLSQNRRQSAVLCQGAWMASCRNIGFLFTLFGQSLTNQLTIENH